MLELEHTCEQIGNRGERDVRVRAHVDPMTRRELLRPHVIEENEWAHHLVSCCRKDAAHDQAAQIALARTHQL